MEKKIDKKEKDLKPFNNLTIDKLLKTLSINYNETQHILSAFYNSLPKESIMDTVEQVVSTHRSGVLIYATLKNLFYVNGKRYARLLHKVYNDNISSVTNKYSATDVYLFVLYESLEKYNPILKNLDFKLLKNKEDDVTKTENKCL